MAADRPFPMRWARRVTAIIVAAWAGAVAAAPCANFTDVADSEGFCTAVEWLRNRSITLGCTATAYCPNQTVTRDFMALFLNRLGTALTPQLHFAEDALDAVALDASPVLCATPVVLATAYPRQALVSIAFGGQAGGALGFAARPVVSTNDGATWSPLVQHDVRESVAAASWTSAATSGIHAIGPMQSVRYGVGVVRHSGTADFVAARCQTVAQVVNANGTTSPLDAR
jgi:hypothetical protein